MRWPRTSGFRPARLAAGRASRRGSADIGLPSDAMLPLAGCVSYASRLMFSKCFGEMLSDVMLPPHPPHPSVIAGSSPVVMPTDPCVVGVLTTMRNAGFLRPNSRMI